MSAASALLFALAADGLTVQLDGQNLRVTPVSRMTPAHRDLIVANKPDLLALLNGARATTAALMTAIDEACAARGDDETNRLGLRSECADLPPHEAVDLLEHFRAEVVRCSRPLNPITDRGQP